MIIKMAVKKKTSITFFILMDIFIAIVSAIAPFVFRFGIFSIRVQPWYLESVLKLLPADILIFIAVNALLRLYNRVWTYASVNEMYDCIKSAVITEAIYMVYRVILGISMFRSYYPFNFMMMLIMLCASRFMVRAIRGIERSRHKKGDKYNVMVIGGGAAATMLIREYQLSSRRINIACIIDDNLAKKGKTLSNVPIIGGREMISASRLAQGSEDFLQ